MECPPRPRVCACGSADLEEEYDEVDIGVGALRRLRGVTCMACGRQTAIDPCCGRFGSALHEPWCPDLGEA